MGFNLRKSIKIASGVRLNITKDAIPVAVEYVHHLIALFSHQQHKANGMNTILPWHIA